MDIQTPQAFTVSYPGRTNILLTECGISKDYVPKTSNQKQPAVESFTGLWDTGATNSVITQNVVDKLGLVPYGFARTYHAAGESIVNRYIVNIYLPNRFCVPSLRVTDGILNGADVLIGMDIISQGDFSVCCAGGKSKFSFQLPSTHDHDYVKEHKENFHTPAMAGKTTGRNEPCHCGSGKKHKNCCFK